MTIKKDLEDAQKYADKVVTEMSALSDKEILEAAVEEYADTKTEAERIRSVLLGAAVAHGKARLKVAQEELSEEDALRDSSEAVVLSFEAKRAKLARIIAQNPQLTLAARQGGAMDEAEVDGYLADLAELGIADATDKDER